MIKGEVTGDLTKPEAIGIELAHQLKDKGAQDILNKIIAEFRTWANQNLESWGGALRRLSFLCLYNFPINIQGMGMRWWKI